MLADAEFKLRPAVLLMYQAVDGISGWLANQQCVMNPAGIQAVGNAAAASGITAGSAGEQMSETCRNAGGASALPVQGPKGGYATATYAARQIGSSTSAAAVPTQTQTSPGQSVNPALLGATAPASDLMLQLQLQVTALSHASCMMTMLDMDGHIVWQNARSLQYMGWPARLQQGNKHPQPWGADQGNGDREACQITDPDHPLKLLFSQDPSAYDSMWQALEKGQVSSRPHQCNLTKTQYCNPINAQHSIFSQPPYPTFVTPHANNAMAPSL